MFNEHKAIAKTHRDGQFFKTRLLSWAQRILIVVAGGMMAFSVLFYKITAWTFTLSVMMQAAIYFIVPLLIAACVEALIILSAHAVNQNRRNVLAWVTLIFSTGVSAIGGTLFFGKLGEGQDPFVQLAFHAFGILVPVMQIMYELNQDNITSFITQAIDTQTLDTHILHTQTQSNIAELQFDARQHSMQSDQVRNQIASLSDGYVIAQVTGVTTPEGEETIITEVDEPSSPLWEMLKELQEQMKQQQQPLQIESPNAAVLNEILFRLEALETAKQSVTVETEQSLDMAETEELFRDSDRNNTRTTDRLAFVSYQQSVPKQSPVHQEPIETVVETTPVTVNETAAKRSSAAKRNDVIDWANALSDEERARYSGPKGKQLRKEIAAKTFHCNDMTVKRALENGRK
jgi:hypothetical protein